MKFLEKGHRCKPQERLVTYRNPIFGNKITGCVSTKKQPYVIKNVTYFRGMHCIVQPFKENTSEYDIFNEHVGNWTGRDDKDRRVGSFIMKNYSDDEMVIGLGTGAMMGGLDKELTYKPVSKKVYENIKGIQKLYEYYDELENKHNFLFGDSNAEIMEDIRKKRYELKNRIGETSGLWC